MVFLHLTFGGNRKTCFIVAVESRKEGDDGLC